MPRIRVAACAALATMATLTGCEFTGINSYPLPFTAGAGSDAYTVTVEMANSVNLVPNSEVKVQNITVGSVRKIEFKDWHAVLTVGLDKAVNLHGNAVARIGQKSLLGAEYLELANPPGKTDAAPLRDGDVIPLARSGRYPETEEVLSALSLMLNGGGLDQLATITRELNQVFGGREQEARELLTRLDGFVGALAAQRREIVRALDGLNRLSGTFAAESKVLTKAFDTIPPGLETLNRERANLTRTLDAMSDFGQAAGSVLESSQADLRSNLRALQPVLRELADAGRHLPKAIGGLTVPFPLDSIKDTFRGDYMNLFITLDVRPDILARNFLTASPLEGVYTGLLGAPLVGPGIQAVDPLRAPLSGLSPDAGGSAPSPSASSDSTGSGGGSGGVGGLLNPLLGGGR